MGGIVSGIVGGVLGKSSGSKASKQATKLGKKAAAQYSPYQTAGSDASTAISSALGLSGDTAAQDEAFQNFLNSTGYQSQLAAGQQAVTGSRAASGLLNSGATLKALQQTGQDLAQQGYTNYLSQLGSVANRGLSAASGAANALSSAGQQAISSQQQGSSALQSGLGQAASGVFGLLGI